MDVFGNELNRYSIADGIRDTNALGFDPYMILTYKERDFGRQSRLTKPMTETFANPKKKNVYLSYIDRTKVPIGGYKLPKGLYLQGIEDYLTISQYEREEY